MHHGKYAKKMGQKPIKPVALVVSLALLLALSVGGVIAFLVDATDPLANPFDASNVTTAVIEDFDGSTKSNVKIQNTGDTIAWIRAAVIVTWKNADGHIYASAPIAGTDYTIAFSDSGWLMGDDGFYYHIAPVAPGESTETLISSCTYTKNAPDGYSLNVEIVGSGIQSKPASVFNTQWESSGLKVDEAKAKLVRKGGGEG